MKTSIKRMCAVGLVTLSLACATGCTAAADTTVPTVSEEQAKSELNQYGNNNGGYNNVQDAEAQYSNDVVSIAVKNGKEHVVSLEDAKKIFRLRERLSLTEIGCQVLMLWMRLIWVRRATCQARWPTILPATHITSYPSYWV